MTRPHMDDNDRARFADGLMPEEERGATVAHIASSPDEAELLADVAYMLADLDPEGGVIAAAPANAGQGHTDDEDTGTDPKVVPLRPPSLESRDAAGATRVGPDAARAPLPGRADAGTDAPVVPLPPPSTARTRRRSPARWVLAAVLAGVLLVPLALSRSGNRDPGDFATLLASRDAGLPDDWPDTPRWGGTRGGEDVVVDTALAAQLGALQVDLEVAAAAGQADAVEQFSGRIVAKLGGVQGSGPVAAIYDDIGDRAREPAETLVPDVEQARESLVAFVDEDYFSLGAWAEAASLAVRRQDAAFFRTRASRKMVDRAASLPSLDGETRRIVNEIRAASASDQPDWSRLAGKPDALLSNIAY